MASLVTLTSLLISVALLLLGHGMQLTLLPLRASLIGHSDLQIAIGGSAYFLGFIVGCMTVPRLIARVGHIRSFAVLASAMCSTLLVLSMLDAFWLWALLRLGTGIFICGLYSVIESWLNDQTDESNRGQILSIYTFLVLIAMAGGQQIIAVTELTAPTPFTLLAAIIAISMIPVCMTRTLAPAPVESTRTRIRLLISRSPTAVIGALCSGAVTGAFWSLGPIFARQTLNSVSETTLFMTAAILGGALCQYPFGWLSDRIGRKNVLLLLALLAAVSSAAVALAPTSELALLAIFFFGATTMPIYAMALASAADASLRHEFVEIGSTVLLLNAAGAVLAPLALGQLMQVGAPSWLFFGCAGLAALTAISVLLARGHRAPVDDVVPFSAAASEMAPTSFDLDPRAPEDAEGDIAPVPEPPAIIEAQDLQSTKGDDPLENPIDDLLDKSSDKSPVNQAESDNEHSDGKMP